MLLKLEPIQVSSYWNLAKEMLQESLPEECWNTPEKLNNMLRAALDDRMQLWVIPVDGTCAEVRAMLATYIVDDDVCGVRDLLIYALKSFVPISDKVWFVVGSEMDEYARLTKCDRVVAFANEPRVIELMEAFGYNSDYRLLTKEVKRDEDLYKGSNLHGNNGGPRRGVLPVRGPSRLLQG